VIILGIILAVIGYFTGIGILYTIGGILVVVGVILWILGAVGLRCALPAAPIRVRASAGHCGLALRWADVLAQRADQRVGCGLLDDVGSPPAGPAHHENRCEASDIESH
jgi:hypothetical protein